VEGRRGGENHVVAALHLTSHPNLRLLFLIHYTGEYLGELILDTMSISFISIVVLRRVASRGPRSHLPGFASVGAGNEAPFVSVIFCNYDISSTAPLHYFSPSYLRLFVQWKEFM
jgi:hypothetical protein